MRALHLPTCLPALILGLTLAAPLVGCGGAPPTKTATAEAAPEAPAPDTANPCDSVSIDPTQNPCAIPVAAEPAAEGQGGEAEPAAEGDAEPAADSEDGEAEPAAKDGEAEPAAEDGAEPEAGDGDSAN